MVHMIEFTATKYEKKDDNNLLSNMTENTIVLCNNLQIMTSLAEEIIKTINGQAEYNDYYCESEDVGTAKYILNFGLQKLIGVQKQRITLSLEPAIIYKARTIDDFWLFDWAGGQGGVPYREFIYPITVFKGSHELWNKGLDEVYEYIVNGRYGTYDGKWVK